MKLYELTNDFQQLFESLDEMTDNENLTEEERQNLETAWYDTLEGIEMEFDDKAENVAAYIKMVKSEAEMLKAEESSLKARRLQKEKHIERLKSYLLENMNRISRKKIDGAMARISVRNNPETAVFSDEKGFIEWAKIHNDDFLRYKEPEINKTEVRKFLQDGGEIQGVSLGRSQSVIIK